MRNYERKVTADSIVFPSTTNEEYGKGIGKSDVSARAWVFTQPACMTKETRQSDKCLTGEELELALTEIPFAAGFEIGETERDDGTGGYQHWQGLIISKTPIRFSTLKKRLPNAHLERCKSRKASWEYINKEQKSDGSRPWCGTITRDEVEGAVKCKRTKASMVELGIRKLKDGYSPDEVIADDFSMLSVYRDLAVANNVLLKFRYASEKLEPLVNVIYIYGKTGIGKSYASREFTRKENGMVVPMCKDQFDDVEPHHKVLLFDEFEYEGNYEMNVFLTMIDQYSHVFRARYYNRYRNCHTMIFVSNLTFEEQFRSVYRRQSAQRYKALCRRFTAVVEQIDRTTYIPRPVKVGGAGYDPEEDITRTTELFGDKTIKGFNNLIRPCTPLVNDINNDK